MDDETGDDKTAENRLAMGVALGAPFGVLLSLLLDNWAFIGVGIALGAAFGAIPAGGSKDSRDGKDEPPNEDG